MSYDLTDNQQAILEFLKERSGGGVPPTVREICQAVGLRSTSSVQANLLALEEKGYIMRDPMHKRSIRIVGQSENVRHVPLLGVVTAGLPILATEQIECYIPFNGSHISSDKVMFALRVRGESMINAGIFDGDILYVEKTPVARNGDIVVALASLNNSNFVFGLNAGKHRNVFKRFVKLFVVKFIKFSARYCFIAI